MGRIKLQKSVNLNYSVTVSEYYLLRPESSGKGYLEELDSNIKKRNKLIRLADKSAAGWDLVNEYLSDELASGSEDEKRIRRAEQRALRKRKDRQQQKVKSTVKQSQRSATTTLFAGQPQFNFRSSSRSFTPIRKATPGDSCFACGQQGHWRSQCRASVLASQILVSPQTLEVNKILPANLSYKLSIYFYLLYLVTKYLSNLDCSRERDSRLLLDFDYDHNLFEYEQDSASPLLKGRLKTKLDYWHAIGANNFVIGTIKLNLVIGS